MNSGNHCEALIHKSDQQIHNQALFFSIGYTNQEWWLTMISSNILSKVVESVILNIVEPAFTEAAASLLGLPC